MTVTPGGTAAGTPTSTSCTGKSDTGTVPIGLGRRSYFRAYAVLGLGISEVVQPMPQGAVVVGQLTIPHLLSAHDLRLLRKLT